jgi:hypothetical protein
VVEIDGAGKYLALNEGDRLAGDVYPRLYCDADIRLSASSIVALVEALTTDKVKVAGPQVRHAVEESTWTVRMFFRAFESPVFTRWLSEHLVGRGLYGASRAARRRFESFPALYADDLFFDSQFELTEKVIPPDAIVTLWVPVNLRQLIRGEVRVTEGNRQYRAAEFDGGGITDHAAIRSHQFELRLGDRIKSVRRWRRDLRGCDLVPVFVYLGVLAATRTILDFKKLRGRQIHWR